MATKAELLEIMTRIGEIVDRLPDGIRYEVGDEGRKITLPYPPEPNEKPAPPMSEKK